MPNLSSLQKVNTSTNRHTERDDLLQLQYQGAKQKIKIGRNIFLAGTLVSVLGVISYCLVSFNTTIYTNDLGILYAEKARIFTIGIVGFGTLLWLVGSFMHLKGMMDDDPHHDKEQYINNSN